MPSPLFPQEGGGVCVCVWITCVKLGLRKLELRSVFLFLDCRQKYGRRNQHYVVGWRASHFNTNNSPMAWRRGREREGESRKVRRKRGGRYFLLLKFGKPVLFWKTGWIMLHKRIPFGLGARIFVIIGSEKWAILKFHHLGIPIIIDSPPELWSWFFDSLFNLELELLMTHDAFD